MKSVNLFYRPCVIVISSILILTFIIHTIYTINSDYNLKLNGTDGIVCMVLTTESNILTRGIAVYETWVCHINNFNSIFLYYQFS